MSTVERPVTQIVETAVKSASAKGARLPDAVAAGIDSSSVNSVISATKMSTAKRAGDDVVSERTSSYSRLKNRRTPKRENGLTGSAAIRSLFDSLRSLRAPPSRAETSVMVSRGARG